MDNQISVDTSLLIEDIDIEQLIALLEKISADGFDRINPHILLEMAPRMEKS